MVVHAIAPGPQIVRRADLQALGHWPPAAVATRHVDHQRDARLDVLHIGGKVHFEVALGHFHRGRGLLGGSGCTLRDNCLNNYRSGIRLHYCVERVLVIVLAIEGDLRIVSNSQATRPKHPHTHTHIHFVATKTDVPKKNNSHSRTDALEYRGCSQQQATHKQNG